MAWSAPPANEAHPDQDQNISEENSDETPVPDIEAKMFGIKVIRRSNSNKIYLFDDPDGHQPSPGKLILLRREDEPIMAFRVLKTYPEEKRIAAKRIKKYGKHRLLGNDETYLALEKTSEIAPALPTEQDRSELKDLESKESDKIPGKITDEAKEKLGIQPFDKDLDAASSPPPPKEKDSKDGSIEPLDLEDEEDSHLAVAVEEVHPIDHNTQWLTAGFGFVRNRAPPSTGGYYYFSSGNLRYALNIGQMILMEKAHLQDSISLEGGFYLYKSIGFTPSQGDAYTVLSIIGNLRYNIFFSRRFGVFFYGGIIQNGIVSSSQSQDSARAALISTLPAFGTGLLFEVGPNWYTRADIGIDSISLNLVLRF